MEPSPDDLNELEALNPLELEVPVQQTIEPKTKKFIRAMSFFWFGKKEYMVTPMIVNINLVVFLIVISMGATILLPFSEYMLSFGCYYRPLALRTEWWRLLTSFFVHTNLIILAINMFALICIGIVLEPILGKTRFITVYLLSGIIGSVTSLAWQEMSISIGASGAIFGLYGVFFALFTVGLIKEVKWTTLLISLAFFIAYHIFHNLYEDLDHAAHIGGFLTGLLIGYTYTLSLKIPSDKRLQLSTTIGIIIVILAATSLVYATTSNDAEAYDKNIKQFMECESMAINVIFQPRDPHIPAPFKEKGIPYWHAGLKCLDKIDELQLAQPLRKRNVLLRHYCEIRIKTYETYHKIYNGADTTIWAEYRLNDRELIQVMHELSGKAQPEE